MLFEWRITLMTRTNSMCSGRPKASKPFSDKLDHSEVGIKKTKYFLLQENVRFLIGSLLCVQSAEAINSTNNRLRSNCLTMKRSLNSSCEFHPQNSSVLSFKDHSVNVLILSSGIVLTISLDVFVVVVVQEL